MRHKKYPVTNIGTSLILTVFIILALVTFAVLSMINTNHDYEFTKKIADRTSMYYEASNTAQEILSQIDETAKSHASDDPDSYYTNIQTALDRIDGLKTNLTEEGLSVSYSVPAGESQTLEADIDILRPSLPSDHFYAIRRWQEVSAGNWNGESKLNLLK